MEFFNNKCLVNANYVVLLGYNFEKEKNNHKIMLDFIVLYDHKYVTILKCPLPSY